MLQWGFTEQALNETGAVLSSANLSPSQERRFIELLCFGAGGQKDRPVYDLCTVIVLLGQSAAASSLPSPSGLEIVSMTGPSLWKELSSAATTDSSKVYLSGPSHVSVVVDGETFEISRSRLSLMPLLADFLLSMADFSFASEWMDICQKLAASSPSIKHRDAVNAASRAIYAYRRDHLNLYGAHQVHRDIVSFLQERCDGSALLANDDHIRELWSTSDGAGHVSFSALLAAIQTLREEERDRVEQRSKNHPIRLDQAISYGSNIVFGDLLHSNQVAELQKVDLSVDQNQRLMDATEDLLDNPLPLLPKSQLRALTSWWRFQSIAGALPQSVLRALSFAPVSNGLSNMRRTGKSKITLEERLTCMEALPYTVLLKNLETAYRMLEEAGRELLSYSDSKLALAEISTFERAQRAKRRRDSRAKGHSLPLSEQKAHATQAIIPLVILKIALSEHQEAQSRLANPLQHLEATFKEDLFIFQEVLTRIYGVQDDIDES